MKRIADQNLYEILDVPRDAAAEVIAAACERARALYGPGSLATYTLMSPDEAALLASRIDEAKATLLDAAARARYDAALDGRGEARAVAGSNGATGAPPSFASFAPVIPAAPPAEPAAVADAPAVLPPAPPREEAPAPATAAAAEEPARPAAPLTVSPAAPEGARPILLQREVSPATAHQAPARAEAPPPVAAPEPRAPVVPAAPTVPDGSPWTGEVLRQLREARGISVQQIAERTKVTRHHIENIEAERFGQLPAAVYLRGILLALARELRLDGQKVARSYLERVSASAQKPR